MTDLSDAALRERAQEIIDGGMHGERYSAKRLGDLFVALCDAAIREGELREAAKHADCCIAREELDAARAGLAIPCQRHGCMWDAQEAHEACRAKESVILEASTAWLEESLRAEERGRAEQREASAGLIYELAHSMAERGLFVRDGFGEPNILAIRELEAALRSQR